MLENEDVGAAIKSASSMVEQLRKAFGELESHSSSSSKTITKWDDVAEYFDNLENSLKEKIGKFEQMKKELEEKQSEIQASIAEREAVVADKELALLDRLQELKDVAVSAITGSCEKYRAASPNLDPGGSKEEEKVSIVANADTNTPVPFPDENLPDSKSGESAKQIASKGHQGSILKKLCEQMDAKGLLKHISENRRNLATLREELSLALKSSIEPARLVLDALEGFYPPNQPVPQGNEKDAALQGLRRSCLVLMESAAPVLDMTVPGDGHPSEIKQQAKAIADQWKPKLALMDTDASNGNTLEAQAFLQLLATFRIASEFGEDELCKIIPAVSHRRQTPEVCRSLGLTHKMPGVLETLVNTGKQIDAVHFAHAFQLTQSFPPVPLLKEYLNYSGRSVQEKSGNIGDALSQKDAIAQELGALKTVIRCIEEYKLQSEFPIGPLQKRVAELEKAKANKKRTPEAAKFRGKKPRGNATYTPRKSAITVEFKPPLPSNYDERRLYSGVQERYPYAAPVAYEAPGPTSYGHQASVPRQYHYPIERAAPTPYGASPNYSNYAVPGAQTAYPSHGSYLSSGLQAGSNYAANSYTGTGYLASSAAYGSYTSSGYQPSHQSYM